MSVVAYADNGIMMAKSYLGRQCSDLSKMIISHHEDYSFAIIENDDVYAYDIRKNESLSEIYGFDCFVIKFAFSSIDTLHGENQESVLKKLLLNLRERISGHKGYYNVRIPTHISDLTRAFNDVFSGSKQYFCGGTVEYVQTAFSEKEFEKHPDLKLFYADKEYLKNHSERLIDLAHDSFRSYQGQYHISPVTSPLAGQIYADWIKNSISESSDDDILIAEIGHEIAGYCTFKRNGGVYEGILSSVDPLYRKHSVYKSLISFLANEAQKEGGFFFTSTQFDNFIVQSAWISLGLKPFYSIYNYHLDYLD